MNDEKIPRSDQTGHNMVEFIEQICKETGPRPGGSEAEQKAGNIIYNEFNVFCDEIIKDHFTCRLQGFLDFIWITTLLYISGAVSYFFIHPIYLCYSNFSSNRNLFCTIEFIMGNGGFSFP